MGWQQGEGPHTCRCAQAASYGRTPVDGPGACEGEGEETDGSRSRPEAPGCKFSSVKEKARDCFKVRGCIHLRQINRPWQHPGENKNYSRDLIIDRGLPHRGHAAEEKLEATGARSAEVCSHGALVVLRLLGTGWGGGSGAPTLGGMGLIWLHLLNSWPR